jgi:hypothetical protein
MSKKTENGGGSIEWRKGVAFVRIALPRAPGEPLQRKRLPVGWHAVAPATRPPRAGARRDTDRRDV